MDLSNLRMGGNFVTNWAMNIGCDVENVAVFRQHWKQKNTRFFKRIFSDEEIEYCKKFRDPAPNFAARFCAKEAVVKAASIITGLVINDIKVTRSKQGAPKIEVWKKRKSTTKFFRDYRIVVSLSHTKDVAIACVLIQRKKD